MRALGITTGTQRARAWGGGAHASDETCRQSVATPPAQRQCSALEQPTSTAPPAIRQERRLRIVQRNSSNAAMLQTRQVIDSPEALRSRGWPSPSPDAKCRACAEAGRKVTSDQSTSGSPPWRSMGTNRRGCRHVEVSSATPLGSPANTPLTSHLSDRNNVGIAYERCRETGVLAGERACRTS